MMIYNIIQMQGKDDDKIYCGIDSADESDQPKIQPNGLVISQNNLRDENICFIPRSHVLPNIILATLVTMW